MQWLEWLSAALLVVACIGTFCMVFALIRSRGGFRSGGLRRPLNRRLLIAGWTMAVLGSFLPTLARSVVTGEWRAVTLGLTAGFLLAGTMVLVSGIRFRHRPGYLKTMLCLGIVLLFLSPWPYLISPLLGPAVLREVRRFEGHHSVVSRVALSADGQRALSTSSGYGDDNSIHVWDTATGRELRRLDGGRVYSLTLSADGRRALTGSHNGITLWDLDSGEALQQMKADTPFAPSVYAVSFSPDGKQALWGAWDGTVRVWDLATGQELRKMQASANHVMSVAFAPGGRLGASGSGSGWHKRNAEQSDDNFVQIWDLTTGEELFHLNTDQDTATCLAFSPDGHRLLAASKYGFIAWIWDVSTGRELQRLNTKWQVVAVSFSPDGQGALCLDSNWRMGLWDVTGGKEVGRAAVRQDYVECAAFAANGRFAVSGDRNRIMWLWALPE